MAALAGVFMLPLFLGVLMLLAGFYGLLWLTILALHLTHNYDEARRLTAWQRHEIRAFWAAWRR